MKRSFSRHRNAGFTLLEVMLAVALFALLIGGIFATQRGALIISRDITEQQEKSMRINSFVELMRRNLEQAPGNSKVFLQVPRGQDGVSELYFKEYPLAFAWSGISAGAKGVLLRTERNSARQFSAVILYLDAEAAEDYQNGKLNEKSVDHATGKPHVRRLELMDGIKSLVWRVIDDATIATNSRNASAKEDEKAWVEEWPLDKSNRPSRARFKLEMADNSEPIDLIFWIPVTVSPESFANGGTGAPTPGGGPPGINNQTGPTVLQGPGGTPLPGVVPPRNGGPPGAGGGSRPIPRPTPGGN